MNKILIKKAILQENIYMINNHNTSDFNPAVYSVKGRLKIINFVKFKLNKEKTSKKISEEHFDNMIGKLELEYTNLNTYENYGSITDSFYLSDLDEFRYKTINNMDVKIAISEYLNEAWDSYNISYFIPKIKTGVTLLYLLPDEETDYFFELNEGTIEEV